MSGNYSAGSIITFNVECKVLYYVIVQLYAPCRNNNYEVNAWTNYEEVGVGGYDSPKTFTLYYITNGPSGIGKVTFQAGATYGFWLGGSLTIYNMSVPGNPVINKTSSWYFDSGSYAYYSQPLTINTLPGMVYKAVYSSPGCASPAPPGSGSNTISITVSDPNGAGWSITWSGGASGSKSGSSSTSWTISASSTVYFNAKITSNPSGYTCQISPSSTRYYFNNLIVTLNGQTIVNTQTSSASYTFTCPSNLNSNQTYSLVGTANYNPRYLKYLDGNTINPSGSGTFSLSSIASGSFSWQDPLFISGSWSITYQQYGTSLKVTVTLNDQYSESGTATPLSASATLAINQPNGYACVITNVSQTTPIGGGKQ